MFELLALISTDPVDLITKPKYPSGEKAGDGTIYKYSYPSSENPVVRFPYRIQYSTSSFIEPGFYEVVLSSDDRFLSLMQSNELVMRIPVISLEEKSFEEETYNHLSQDDYIKMKKNNKKKQKSYKNKSEDELREIKGIAEQREQAYLKASVRYSHAGYYILIFENKKVRAYGYIPCR